MPVPQWLRVSVLTGLLLLSLATGATAQFALTLTASQPSYATGDTLALSLSVENPGLPAVADFYFGCLLPDGDTVFFFADLTLRVALGRASQPSTLSPMARGVSLATPFTVHQSAFIRHTWAGSEPTGRYLCFLAAAPPGGLGTGPVLGLATAEFTLTAAPSSNAINGQVTLDPSRAITAIVPITGGTLTTTAADGTRFTLTVPPDALLVQETITMTPISAVAGFPSGTFVASVQLQPEGIRLYQFATLTVEPATPVPVTSQRSLASRGDGQQVHGYPLDLHPPGIAFKLMHFSIYYVWEGVAPWDVAPWEYVLADSEDQLMHDLEGLLRRERVALHMGTPGDPEFLIKLEFYVRGYYDRFLAPRFAPAAMDCAIATLLVHKGIAWLRWTQKFFFEPETFAAQDAALNAAFMTGLDTCWNDLTRACLNPNDHVRRDQLLSIGAQARLLGLVPDESARFDIGRVPVCPPEDPARFLQVNEWTFSFTLTANETLDDRFGITRWTVRQSVNASFTLSRDQVFGIGNWTGNGTVSVDLYQEGVTPQGLCITTTTYTGSETIAPPPLTLNIIVPGSIPRYILVLGGNHRQMTVTRRVRQIGGTCSRDQTDQFPFRWGPVSSYLFWINTPLPASGLVISGSERFRAGIPAGDAEPEWKVTWTISPSGSVATTSSAR